MIQTLQNIKQSTRNLKPAKIYKGELYKGMWLSYIPLYCGFDIETTSYEDNSYMYVWQFSYGISLDDIKVVKGRTWHEFTYFIGQLKRFLNLRESTRIIIWVANLSYEFSFIRKLFCWDELFAKEKRQPLLARSGGIEFRECLSISGGNLDYLAKTYCKTRKLVGDLDYNKLRNSKTPLTAEEEAYCNNDVIILAEFSHYIFQTYIFPKRFIPLTSTAILRFELKERAKLQYRKLDNLYEAIKKLYPATVEDYIFDMMWLFRGGFVHGEYSSMLDIIYNLKPSDLKSSYPASMLQCYYPVSPFEEYLPKDEADFYRILKEYCCIFQITFHNIRSKTKHSIESKSKCIRLENPLIDNGRVREADLMTVYITEVDFFNAYDKFYEWESFELHSIKIAKKGCLPRYLLDMVYMLFQKKESIDKEEDPTGYAVSKQGVNGMYGMCVTRLEFNNVTYDGLEWGSEANKKSYDDMISRQLLSPYWGIYITCHSRARILSLLADLQDVVYTDTDSHKYPDTDYNKKVVDEFNTFVTNLNREICAKYGYDFKIIGALGTFQDESIDMGMIKRFKGAGAKRYICEYEKAGFIATISGLSKKALNNYCKKTGIDAFQFFDHKMSIPASDTGKLRAIYNDSPSAAFITDEFGNTEEMKELSNVCLVPVEFTMNLDKDYIRIIKYMTERMTKHGSC